MRKITVLINNSYFLLFVLLSIIIFNCKDDVVTPSNNSEVIIPATTKVVDSTDFANHFVSLSNDSTVYTFSKGSASIDNLMVNDVLVSKFRRGILRKVTGVQTNNQNTIITTTNTTICDAVQKGGVSVSKTLAPEDTLMINPGPGVKLKGMKNDNPGVIIYSATFEKTEGPLSITGSITLSESFNFSIQIENWSIVNLVFSATPSVVTQINGSCNVLNLNFQKEWELATINFNPITIYIGTVPVVITPSIRIFVDANGSVHAGVSSSINQTSTVTGGLQYSNGSWSPISSHSETFTFTPPTYSAEANLKASVGADLTLLLYGFAGPYVEPSFFGDLQVQSNLNATLYIGFDLSAGVAVQVLGHNIANHSMTHIVFVNNPVWTNSGGGLSVPTLISPPNGATNQSLTPILDWSDVTGATAYRVQVSTSSSFTTTLVDQQNLTSSQFVVPGGFLSNNTQYYWRANASNSQNTSNWSSVWSFSPGLPAPTLISPPNGATNQPLTPTLDWSDVAGATAYRVQVSTSSSFTTTVVDQQNLTSSQYVVPSGLLNNNTQYYWRANASNSQSLNPWSVLPGISPWSATWSFTTLSSTGLPAPTLLSPPNGATNQPLTPTLDWSDVTGATTYRVQVSTSSSFTTTVVDQQNLTSSQYVVPSGLLNNNTQYYWRANASNTQNTSAWSSVWSFTTIGSTGLSAPTLLSPPNGATNQSLTPTLDWSDVSGATAYRVQVSTSSSFTTTVVDQQNLIVSQYVVPSGLLNNNIQYYWRANASNTQNTSAWSSVWNFTTQLGGTGSWSPLGSGLDNFVRALIIYNNELIVGGAFTSAGGISANHIAKWNGNNWSSIGNINPGDVWDFAIYNGNLIVGGQFTTAGGISANNIVQWNGNTWTTLGSGTNTTVTALGVFDGFLVASGNFSTAGGVSAPRIARWNGTQWSAMGTNFNGAANDLFVFNNQLYAGANSIGSNFGYLNRWTGTAWVQTGNMNNSVYALMSYNNELIAGGSFTYAGSGSANCISKWNGSSWSNLGSGLNAFAKSLSTFNGKLIVGGAFTTAGGVNSNYIAQWNGTSWFPMGSGISGNYPLITALVEFNGALVAGGEFTLAGGISANNIAKWTE
jgi:hypothetical protein